MSEWNSTDDELRDLAYEGGWTAVEIADLARLVLREREELQRQDRRRLDECEAHDREVRRAEQAEAERDELREYNRLLVAGNHSCLKEAHDELDQARAALARVEDLAAHRARIIDALISGRTPPPDDLDAIRARAAIAGGTPPAGVAEQESNHPGPCKAEYRPGDDTRRCSKGKDHDGEHRSGAITWRDPMRVVAGDSPAATHKFDPGVSATGADICRVPGCQRLENHYLHTKDTP